MELELKHIAPYLPYGVRRQWNFSTSRLPKNIDVTRLVTAENVHHILGEHDRPSLLLRPLSELTEEIEYNGENFRVQDLSIYAFATPKQLTNPKWMIANCFYDDLKILFKWHFDVFGLIDAGLAIKKEL